MTIASLIDQNVERAPYKKALFYPLGKDRLGRTSYTHLTYKDLQSRANKIADGLKTRGVRKGTKVLLFVRPSLEFPVLAYALFKIGAVAVLIDPGMGPKNLVRCIKSVEPEVLIAVPEVFVAKKIFRDAFRSIKSSYIVDQSNGVITALAKALNPSALNFIELEEKGRDIQTTAEMASEDLAAIVFTSGGTGAPKGVEYTHEIYEYQVDLLRETYSLTTDDVDLPAFPLFALFTLAMGMSVVIPDMDPTKPAKADPARLVEHINNHGVTFTGGSPAIFERVANYCHRAGMTLPSVRSLMMFGAPVASKIHEAFSKVLVNGTTYTPYGATECLPVSTISGKEILEGNLHLDSQNGKGTCVGSSAKNTEIKIIKQVDGIIGSLAVAEECGVNEVGEIIVKGTQATKRYYKLREKTELAKIVDGDGFWHRMGDMGYLDEKGRLWFCGRVVHKVETKDQVLYSVPTEAHFNSIEGVRRSALVNSGDESSAKPAIVVETTSSADLNELKLKIKEKTSHQKLGGVINDFYIMKDFPVDIRHNIKIDRIKIGEQARLGHLKRI